MNPFNANQTSTSQTLPKKGLGILDVLREIPGELKKRLKKTNEAFPIPKIAYDSSGKASIDKRSILGAFNIAGSVGPSNLKSALPKVASPVSKLLNAIRSAKPAQKALELEQTAARAARADAVSKLYSSETGESAFIKSKGILKGELAAKPKFEPLRVVRNQSEIPTNTAQQTDINQLFTESDSRFLSDYTTKVKTKSGVTQAETAKAKSLLTDAGLKAPEDPKQLADFFDTAMERGMIKSLDEAVSIKPKPTPENTITQADVDDLFGSIQRHGTLDSFDKIAASEGLSQLLRGELPQPSRLSLLEDVFGKELIEEVMKKRSGVEKVKDFLTETLNIPRSLVTSFDMSAPLRQGIVLTVTKPKAALGGAKEMFRQVFSEENFQKWLKDIPNNPLYRKMKDSGLYIADPTKVSGGLSAREEKFMTNFAEKIPFMGSIIRASQRAYVGYLNKLRVDVFTQLTNKFTKEGVATPENLKSLANFINNASGRGSMGSFERVAQELNTVFFSPRLIASRFNMLNPVWYAKQTPVVRKEAIKTMAEFIGVGSSVLMLAKLGGADVEIDPRSTDFGKIKVGNTRWDVWGGFQQWVRVMSQLISGQRKAPSSGDIVELSKKKYPFESRKDVAERFIVGKTAPIPSLVYELLQGQKLFGESISLPREIAENTIPLYLQDAKEVVDEFGPEGIFYVGVPSFFGVGAQTYKSRDATNPFNR